MNMDNTMVMKKDSIPMNHNKIRDKMNDHKNHDMSKMQKDSTAFDYNA